MFADEAVLPKLQGLAAEFPGAAIYLSAMSTRSATIVAKQNLKVVAYSSSFIPTSLCLSKLHPAPKP
jgi:hypothetical protein